MSTDLLKNDKSVPVNFTFFAAISSPDPELCFKVGEEGRLCALSRIAKASFNEQQSVHTRHLSCHCLNISVQRPCQTQTMGLSC